MQEEVDRALKLAKAYEKAEEGLKVVGNDGDTIDAASIRSLRKHHAKHRSYGHVGTALEGEA